MKWRNWLTAILGVWFMISPWAVGLAGHSAFLWTTFFIGLVQVISAVWAATLEDSSGWKVWQMWVTLLTGAWFIITPFVFGIGDNSNEMWASTVMGLVTVGLSLWTMGGSDEGTDMHRGGSGGGASKA